jgi:hypothetical protein
LCLKYCLHSFNCNIFQAPSERIWIHVRGDNQATSLSQEDLKKVSIVDDLKAVIKTLKLVNVNVSKSCITIYKGQKEKRVHLSNSAFVTELYNPIKSIILKIYLKYI